LAGSITYVAEASPCWRNRAAGCRLLAKRLVEGVPGFHFQHAALQITRCLACISQTRLPTSTLSTPSASCPVIELIAVTTLNTGRVAERGQIDRSRPAAA
jgi:hypothetical protein